MRVYIGIVEHRHGVNTYLSRTEAGRDAKVAAYCREWWSDLPEGGGDDPPTDDVEAMRIYFGDNEDESLTTDSEELED